jgi:CBS domain-containing protein
MAYSRFMPRTLLDAAAEMTCGEVMHSRFSTLPGTATVEDVRRWFDASSHRNMAFLADDDDGHFLGSLTRTDVADPVDAARPAAELARREPIVAPGAPTRIGHDLAVASGALRVPVVDAGGRLLGVVAVTEDLAGFCG